MEVSISHERLYECLDEVLAALDLERITNAFLYSLSTRDLKFRAHLACYIFARSIPKHNILTQVYPSENIGCSYCGHCHTYPTDTDHLEIELVKWGGVRFQDVFTATYYLDKCSKMDRVYPSKADFDIFNNIVDVIVSSEDNLKPRDLEKIFGKIFKSNKGEREMLINQLGMIGLLETSSHKGFEKIYTLRRFRTLPTVNKIDWLYPVCWWRGSDGINNKAYRSIFGNYQELHRNDL